MTSVSRDERRRSNNGGSQGTQGTQAVDRAAALIDLVVRAEEPLSYTELVEETGLARSTTSRLLAALERTELLERDDSGAYVAGPLFVLHAALHTPALDIGAGVRAQLSRDGVRVVDAARCTMEDQDLYSYRRQGKQSGRFAGLAWVRP
jgi:DNA-binding IclR family transcriptional regulator